PALRLAVVAAGSSLERPSAQEERRRQRLHDQVVAAQSGLATDNRVAPRLADVAGVRRQQLRPDEDLRGRYAAETEPERMARIGGERDVHAAGVGDHAQHAARRGALDPDAERRMRTGLVPDDALVDAVAAAVGLEEQPR